MAFGPSQALAELKHIESRLPDIALTLMGHVVTVCDDSNPRFEQSGEICDLSMSVDACYLQVSFGDLPRLKNRNATEKGIAEEGSPQDGSDTWFHLDEIQLITHSSKRLQ